MSTSAPIRQPAPFWTSVTDAHNVLTYYRYLCRKQHNMTDPPVVVIGA